MQVHKYNKIFVVRLDSERPQFLNVCFIHTAKGYFFLLAFLTAFLAGLGAFSFFGGV